MEEAVQVAGGFVFRKAQASDPEVLVISDRFGHIALPKGHVEKGELLEEAALREIAEETGICGRIVCSLQRISYAFADAIGRTGTKDAHFFFVEALGGEVHAQVEEVRGARFVSARKVEKLARDRGYPNNFDVFVRGLRLLEDWLADRLIKPDLIDQTMLAADVTTDDVARMCRQARTYGFASVCVNPLFVSECAAILIDSPVKVCTVIGFPLGATTTAAKVEEARIALAQGAQELDMVIAVGKLREGDLAYVEGDIRAVVEEAAGRAIVKVILETAMLSAAEQTAGAQCALRAGADFLKTSTGYAKHGATVEAVERLLAAVGNRLPVKAAGGIRTRETALAMRAAGATRLGSSAGTKLTLGDAALPW